MFRRKGLSAAQLSRLHTFESAARHGSFALAANELCLTPSAVSHRINLLETDLGIRLFQRLHRKIALTPEGNKLFWVLQSSLHDLDREIRDIRNQELSGPLTLYARPSVTQCWLVPRLADFSRLYPSIRLTILTGNEQIDFHKTGIDVALYFDDAPPAGMACEPLMDESIIPVCSPTYARRFELVGKPENLCFCTLLHDQQAWSVDSDAGEWGAWRHHFGFEIMPEQPSMGFDRSDLAVIAALNHVGVAMGRRRLISHRLDRQELLLPFPEMEMACPQWYYALTISERRRPKSDAFIRWLKKQAQDMQKNTLEG